jgi:acyl dehydratase
MTVHFEQIAAGERFASARRTLTEADVMAFAGVTGDFNSALLVWFIWSLERER